MRVRKEFGNTMKTHVLVVCYTQFWDQLEYVKNRREEEDSYKAQEYRYADVQ